MHWGSLIIGAVIGILVAAIGGIGATAGSEGVRRAINRRWPSPTPRVEVTAPVADVCWTLERIQLDVCRLTNRGSEVAANVHIIDLTEHDQHWFRFLPTGESIAPNSPHEVLTTDATHHGSPTSLTITWDGGRETVPIPPY